jgi:hypothetical protein
MCETRYGDEEVVTAQGVYSMLHASGIQNPDMQQLADGQTYHLNGWTVVASGGWTRFINDTTGHGMSVAAQNFDHF